MLGGSAAVFVALKWNHGWNQALAWQQPTGHFWVVSVASIICLVIALAASTVALRVRNARVLLIALSFLSMAGIFLRPRPGDAGLRPRRARARAGHPES